jgi:lipopolysaccharide/colanic/teichoic acid biosynthesis glycosyltransferase
MIVDAANYQADLEGWNSHDDSRTFKIPNDPRVTWIGRLMRRSSVDELPQLFNVLLGHMSLVGPRPPVPGEVAQYTPDDMRRLEVKPGLTCLWQISGRSRLPFPEQLRLDLQYVERRSFWLDFKLLVRTIPAVLSADGAY